MLILISSKEKQVHAECVQEFEAHCCLILSFNAKKLSHQIMDKLSRHPH